MAYKNIEISGELVKFKASAATKILYHQLFKTDLNDEISEYIKKNQNMQSVREALTKAQGMPDSDPGKAQALADVLASKEYNDFLEFSKRFFSQFAYITYLEANEKEPRDVFAKLSKDEFLLWLMNYEAADFYLNGQAFISLWRENESHGSNPKNAAAR